MTVRFYPAKGAPPRRRSDDHQVLSCQRRTITIYDAQCSPARENRLALVISFDPVTCVSLNFYPDTHRFHVSCTGPVLAGGERGGRPGSRIFGGPSQVCVTRLSFVYVKKKKLISVRRPLLICLEAWMLGNQGLVAIGPLLVRSCTGRWPHGNKNTLHIRICSQ